MSNAAAAAAGERDGPQARIEELEAAVLRARADTENVRKRAAREAEKSRQFAIERKGVETGIEALETAIKGDDKSAIDTQVEALSTLAATLAAKAAEKQAGGQAGGGAESAGAEKPTDESVVDAEFEDVSDDRRG